MCRLSGRHSDVFYCWANCCQHGSQPLRPPISTSLAVAAHVVGNLKSKSGIGVMELRVPFCFQGSCYGCRYEVASFAREALKPWRSVALTTRWHLHTRCEQRSIGGNVWTTRAARLEGVDARERDSCA